MMVRILAGLLSVGIFAALAASIVDLNQLDGLSRGLTRQVQSQTAQSGVDHPVTAVLLNFRAYDTWLEIVVLLLAVMGMMVLRRSIDIEHTPPGPETGSVLSWLTRLLLPIMVITGGYVLWLGTSAPGGAFQAGAVIGSAAVLLRLAGYPATALLNGPLLRGSLTIGFIVFWLVAAGLLVLGRDLLDLPRGNAGLIIIVIELFITWSVAVTFAALFSIARPEGTDRPGQTPQGREPAT